MIAKPVAINKTINYESLINLMTTRQEYLGVDKGYVNVVTNKNLMKILTNELNFKTLNIIEIVCVKLPPFKKCKIHNDGSRTYAVILPLVNCEKFYFNWWQPYSEIVSKKVLFSTVENNEMINTLEDNEAFLLHSINMNLPYIVNVSMFHNVENKSFTNLLALSLRFDTDITGINVID